MRCSEYKSQEESDPVYHKGYFLKALEKILCWKHVTRIGSSKVCGLIPFSSYISIMQFMDTNRSLWYFRYYGGLKQCLNILIKYVSWEYRCDEEYLEESHKGKIWNKLDPNIPKGISLWTALEAKNLGHARMSQKKLERLWNVCWFVCNFCTFHETYIWSAGCK